MPPGAPRCALQPLIVSRGVRRRLGHLSEDR
jgi:hypothetical protein